MMAEQKENNAIRSISTSGMQSNSVQQLLLENKWLDLQIVRSPETA